MTEATRTPFVPSAELRAAYPEIEQLPVVLTVQQVAKLLSVSADLIRDHCIAGRIQHLTLGDRRRIPRHEVYRLLLGL